ncbi:ATP-binding protein [Paractinoplanes lichenicola]|uniref:ATP-binding protein n=1 Tax=Paractinoplanes lichenicola TaxID=2802976 RepID=A0ABS1VFR2_9ACTN|nr:ATP-binding protein [Actinoplanes lichenicola]MBL7253538.1 ATP-binding protein [Actinoplanes lichenicola]
MLSPPASISVLLTWHVGNDTDLRTIRDDIRRFVAREPGTSTGVEGTRTAQHLGLVATELAGNALRHGQPPVVVRLLSDDACFIVDVSDRAVRELPSPAPARQGIRAGGRGLPICLALAEQVCWYANETTKHVWASFPRR